MIGRYWIAGLFWVAAFFLLLGTPMDGPTKLRWVVVVWVMAIIAIRQRMAGNRIPDPATPVPTLLVEPGTRIAIPRLVGPRTSMWDRWNGEYRTLVEDLVGDADIEDVTFAQVIDVNAERGTCTILLPPTGTIHGSMERRTIPITKAQQFAKLRERW